MPVAIRSRPAWARGLKLPLMVFSPSSFASRPAWARGLKPTAQSDVALIVVSRPAWARGLKQVRVNQDGLRMLVAPRVGAWIETRPGLWHTGGGDGRAPRGRVD